MVNGEWMMVNFIAAFQLASLAKEFER